MIGCGRIAPGEDDIAERCRVRGDSAAHFIVPDERTGAAQRLGHVEPPGMRFARRDPLRCNIGRKGAAGAGIDRPVGAVRGGGASRDLHCNLGTGAETGVSEAIGRQPLERDAIGGKAL